LLALASQLQRPSCYDEPGTISPRGLVLVDSAWRLAIN
jgi:hypothetical protein